MSDRTLDRESLRDLDGVRVEVEELTSTAKARGISAERLRTAIESRLHQAGIRVQHDGEFPTGDPVLRVRVTTSAERDGLIAYVVELDFTQIVFLRRNPIVTFNRGQTWKTPMQIRLAASARLAASVLQELAVQVGQYVADYMSVNRG